MASALDNRTAILACVVALCVLSLFLAAVLFDHDFSKTEKHCNPHVCFDVISISSVSFGLLAVGNPIGIGVVTVSSFIGVGILPIAPISLGLVPIGIIARGYQILNPFAQKY